MNPLLAQFVITSAAGRAALAGILRKQASAQNVVTLKHTVASAFIAALRVLDSLTYSPVVAVVPVGVVPPVRPRGCGRDAANAGPGSKREKVESRQLVTHGHTESRTRCKKLTRNENTAELEPRNCKNSDMSRWR